MRKPTPAALPLPEPFHSIREVVADLGAPDVTLRQLVGLACLSAAGPEGCKLRDVAEGLNISKPAASRAMTRLVQLGFVVRHGTEADRRDSISRITSKGRIYLGLFAPVPASLRSAA